MFKINIAIPVAFIQGDFLQTNYYLLSEFNIIGLKIQPDTTFWITMIINRAVMEHHPLNSGGVN